MTLTSLLRAVAVVVAVAGVIDPSLSATRRVRPEVALIAGTRLPDPALVDRVAAEIGDGVRVIRGASLGAAATVVVGDALPDAAVQDTRIAFAIRPEPASPFVSITAADAPSRAHLQARIPVEVRVRAQAARGRTVAVTLSSAGTTLDRVSRDVKEDDEMVSMTVTSVATAPGVASFTIAASIDGAREPHLVDVAVPVYNERATVLSFDRRPSWMATFVRRALEADPRFAVTSRVVTSKGVASVAGRAPGAISLEALNTFDVVVAGAPELLTPADVSGLQAFMRKRGGSVVLLLDEPVESPALRGLTGVDRWSAASQATPAGTPPASEMFAPTTLPAWADAQLDGSPAFWSMPVGRGRLFVSGRLDAWRYRHGDANAFDTFWRSVLSEAAAASGRQDAPDRVVAPERRPVSDDRALMEAWASSHRGRVLAERDMSQLPDALARAIEPPAERVTLYPLRSIWWLLPFAGCLGAEWWLRRRSGRR